jgi:predicted DNA-binding transcriptional regulator AlpA
MKPMSPALDTAPIAPPGHAASAALLDVQAVARLLDCSPRHVYRLADAGRMPPPSRLGALVRWRLHGPGGLLDWIERGCKPVRAAGKGVKS